jgi:hypothetical protein
MGVKAMAGTIIVIDAVICSLIGWWISQPSGRGWRGALLGLLFGPVGVLLAWVGLRIPGDKPAG